MSDKKITVSISEMLEAGVHFGHQTKYWNPNMKKYIYGARNKIHIIDLDKTQPMFEAALKEVAKVIRNKGEVLFVGTREQASDIIAEQAIRCGMPYVNHRWLGGMLTNFETVKKSIRKLEQKKAISEKADNGLSKKEALDLTRDLAKLQSTIGGIADTKHAPAALFIIDTGCHDIAVLEARRLGIPVIGIVDTNNNPNLIDFVVPGNDDSAQAIKLYASKVADAILASKAESLEDLKRQIKMEIVEESNEPAKEAKVRSTKESQI